MTDPVQENQQNIEQKQSDKEHNFRLLQAKYERQLEQERQSRMDAEKRMQEYERRNAQPVKEEEEDTDDEPYVDKKRLRKTLSSFEKNLEEKIERKAEEKARFFLDKQKQEMWLKQNPDFYQIMQHAEKFAEHDPDLAETILEMPEGFERQKLVYKNIKALGIHKPATSQPSIQEKIDSNRKSPFYQPTNVSAGPYSSGGDFSQSGQKSAYEKMQELKSRLRLS